MFRSDWLNDARMGRGETVDISNKELEISLRQRSDTFCDAVMVVVMVMIMIMVVVNSVIQQS